MPDFNVAGSKDGRRTAAGGGEGVVQGDANVLVDGRRHEEAAVLVAVAREVGPSSAEREAHGGAGEHHDGAVLLSAESRVERTEPFGRPNLVEPLRRHDGAHAAAPGQLGLKLLETPALTQRELLDEMVGELSDAVVRWWRGLQVASSCGGGRMEGRSDL